MPSLNGPYLAHNSHGAIENHHDPSFILARNFQETLVELGINRLIINYTDMQGGSRGKLIPIHALPQALMEGIGFSTGPYLGLTKGGAGFRALPDPQSFIQLPWDKTCGWLAADLFVGELPLMTSPRVVLKEQIKRLSLSKGLILKTGVEPEFYILPDKIRRSSIFQNNIDYSFDIASVRGNFQIIEKAMIYLAELDWGCSTAFNEDSYGQFEINWGYDECLKTADRHTFFKYMIKELSLQAGLIATFMPKPFNGQAGNGCHVHFSLWDIESKANVTHSINNQFGLSSMGINIIGGLLENAAPLTALLLPCVNSYKRIGDPQGFDNPTACPNTATYGGDNRTYMIRIPAPGRLELRLGDGSTNPYLLQASLIICALYGIDNNIIPGPACEENLYEPGAADRYPSLPLDLASSMKALDKSDLFRSTLGDVFIEPFMAMLKNEWSSYINHISDWEFSTTIDR